MASLWSAPTGSRPWLLALSLLAGLAAAPFGYDVGRQIAGAWLGWVMAVNSAVFSALVAGALLDRLARLWTRKDDAG